MRACTAFAIAFLAGCTPAWAQDLNVREFRRTVDARQVTVVDRLPWYAGESVGYVVVSRRGDDPVQIPEGSVPVWTVIDSATNAYVVATGTVVSATNGEVRFWLPAPQANLPPGNYNSYVTVYQGTNRIGVLDRATVSVSWRPGDDFESAQPLTNVLDQVAGWFADAAGLVALASNSFVATIAAETQAREEAGYLTAETDPDYSISAAAGITTNLIAAWNLAYGWGNHAAAGYLTAETDPDFAAWLLTDPLAGYLTAETDPAFAAAPAYGITTNLIAAWNLAYGWGNHAAAGYLTAEADPDFAAWLLTDPLAGYLTAETDPTFAAAPAYGITTNLIAAWNLAYGWGNHAAAGYLTGFTETDGVFTASAAASIDSDMIADWNGAVGWGNHAAAGYLTGFTETDGVFTASAAASIDSDMIADWNGAVGWGNHAAAGYLTGFTETDGVFTASAAYGITSEAISNWNAAAEWGDHAAAGYLSMDGGGLWTFDEYGVAHLYNADGLGISFVDGEFNGGWWGGYKLYIGDSGTFRMGVNAKNIFLRPDGGTNTVSFDESGNMIIAVDGTAAMTISTNGKVGIGLTPDSAFAVNVPSLKSSSSIQGSRFQDASSITYMVDPYGDSKLLNLVLEGTLKASGLPTATNGLDSGTVWSDGGTLKVMP